MIIFLYDAPQKRGLGGASPTRRGGEGGASPTRRGVRWRIPHQKRG